MGLETTPESPAPVRQIANAIAQWIDRLGAVWVEGQVAQLSRRQGMNTVFLTLRDPVADVSVPVTCSRQLFDSLNPPLVEGARVVVHAKPSYYANRGTLSLRATDIRMVGLGELLARIERRRQLLAAEGLFAQERKRPLPFLPRCVGLVTGAGSAAERDVLEVARRRWPAVEFRVVHAAVQGDRCCPEVVSAIRRLDADPEVEVIIVARGGGDFQNLLGFSDERVVRAAAAASTPIVSAIGHEADRPLLDDVADLRASTPTDAAKRVVPDVAEELIRVEQARARLRMRVTTHVSHEIDRLQHLRSRPALADPGWIVDRRAEDVTRWVARGTELAERAIERAGVRVGELRSQLRALSPLATLQRGYAIVQRDHDGVLTRPDQAPDGTPLRITLAEGRLAATSRGAVGDDE
jgi:exodeoxyribonuclease VII large subunit